MQTVRPVSSRSPDAAARPHPLSRIGPGLIAAASNNDPTTVATLAMVGATTGYALCWLVLLIIPMVTVVQTLAATVGATCRASLQATIRREYGLGWAAMVLAAVGVVNIVTLAADVKAGSEALGLLTHRPPAQFLVPFVAAIAFLLVGRTLTTIERVLSIVSLGFVGYAASALFAHVDVAAFARGALVPQYSLAPAYAMGGIALLGTTLTAYVYLWESIGVAERDVAPGSIRFFEREAAAGMIVVGLIFLFIIVASAATLGAQHVAVNTASDMALALEPLAGRAASSLFGVGLLASAILAVPVIASTTAYVAAHTFGWPGSLNAHPRDAKAFYGVAIGSLAAAAAIAMSPESLVAMLYEASIAGGLATPLTLGFLAIVAGNRRIMGEHAMSRTMAVVAWSIVAVVTAAGIAYLVSTSGGFTATI